MVLADLITQSRSLRKFSLAFGPCAGSRPRCEYYPWTQTAAVGYKPRTRRNEAASDPRLILAAEVMVAAPDFGHLEPMLDAIQRELAAAGVNETPGVPAVDVRAELVVGDALEHVGLVLAQAAQPSSGDAA